MWTPKRILLLFGGLSLFAVFYGVYAYFLGGIDGLPPLPGVYVELYPAGPELPPPPPTPNKTEGDRKLEQAFGEDCPEINRTIKGEFSKKGLAFATDQFIIQEDGRVRLAPFSIGIFNKNHREGVFPEINTVRSEEAFLTFDRPITNMADIGDRKIIGAELRGAITLVNNRRTTQKNDDVEVFINHGPLFFSETKKRIWSDGIIRLVDTQPQPEPTIILAKGLEIRLSKAATLTGGSKKSKSARAGNPPRDNSSVTAVEEILLRSNVNMNMHVDAKSGFLTSSPGGPQAKGQASPDKTVPGGQPADKSQVNITTQGTFTYDLTKELAVFQSPPAVNNPKEVRPFPADKVNVTRIHSKEKDEKFYDHLLCDRLELRFRRKKDVDPRLARTDRTGDREIESAHATARPGNEVSLSLDSENLEAHGDEMIYLSATEKGGSQTIIRGEPLWAVKDAHKITARELHLTPADGKGQGQQAYAKGPGQIDLMDRNSTSNVHQYHALWKDTLVVTKDREGDLELDLLTFTGDAAFIDDSGKQEMHADKLQVWVEPADRTLTPEQVETQKQQKATSAPRQLPHKVEGFGKVRILSPELRLRCEHLNVRFKDGPATLLPEVLPPLAEVQLGEDSSHVVQRADSANLTLRSPQEGATLVPAPPRPVTPKGVAQKKTVAC